MPNRLVSRPASPAASRAFAPVPRPRRRGGPQLRFKFLLERTSVRRASGSGACDKRAQVMEPMVELWNRLGSSIGRWAALVQKLVEHRISREKARVGEASE